MLKKKQLLNTNESLGIWMQDDSYNYASTKNEKANRLPFLKAIQVQQKTLKYLAKEIKTKLSVGGSFKNDKIIIQGDYRDKIMQMLKDKGFNIKRVGG